MLSAAELASMRAAMTASFPDTAIIRSRTAASDGQGGQSESWADGTSVACRLLAETRAEGGEANRPVAVTTWKLLLPHGTSLSPQQRVKIAGTEYEVTETDGAASQTVCLTATLRRVS